MKTRVSFPNLIKEDNEHNQVLAIRKLTFSKSSIYLNWINKWTRKSIHIFWIWWLFLLAFSSLASSWNEVIKDPRGNVQELLAHREHNKRWPFLQRSACAIQHPSKALKRRALVNRTLQANRTPISPGGTRDQHWQTVAYGLRYSWNRLWWGWGAQGTTILHLEPVPPIFRKMSF